MLVIFILIIDIIIGTTVIILNTWDDDWASLYVLAKDVIAIASPDINSDADIQVIKQKLSYWWKEAGIGINSWRKKSRRIRAQSAKPEGYYTQYSNNPNIYNKPCNTSLTVQKEDAEKCKKNKTYPSRRFHRIVASNMRIAYR